MFFRCCIICYEKAGIRFNWIFFEQLHNCASEQYVKLEGKGITFLLQEAAYSSSLVGEIKAHFQFHLATECINNLKYFNYISHNGLFLNVYIAERHLKSIDWGCTTIILVVMMMSDVATLEIHLLYCAASE